MKRLKTLAQLSITATLLISSAKAAPEFPRFVTDFNVFSKESLTMTDSDIQGIVGSRFTVGLKNMGLSYHPISLRKSKASVVANQFILTDGNVYKGNVIAENSILLTNATIAGKKYSKRIEATSNGYPSSTYSNTRVNFPNLDAYVSQMNFELRNLNKLKRQARRPLMTGRYQVFYAVNSNLNVFKVHSLNDNIQISANNNPNAYFIIFVEETNAKIADTYFNLTNGAKNSNILIVFSNATKLNLKRSGTGRGDRSMGIPASIFAPLADVLLEDGLMTGSLLARRITGTAFGPKFQINNGQFVCFENGRRSQNGSIDYTSCTAGTPPDCQDQDQRQQQQQCDQDQRQSQYRK